MRCEEERALGATDRPDADVAAEVYLAVSRSSARGLLAPTALWELCWPGLVLEVTEDRAEKGVRWSVAGRLTGTAEVWLEPWREGCVAHVYLRARPAPGTGRRRTGARTRVDGERARALLFWAKDRLEQRASMPTGPTRPVQ